MNCYCYCYECFYFDITDPKISAGWCEFHRKYVYAENNCSFGQRFNKEVSDYRNSMNNFTYKGGTLSSGNYN